jgi:acyl dehydratase
MLYAVGSPLPEYRVRAFNSSIDSSNLIHNDEHARRFGFKAGLVPGVSIYAYMSRSLVECAAADWLERGSAEVRFLHPVYEGEEVRVTGTLSSVSKDGTLRFEYQAANPQGVVCGAGNASLPLKPPAPEPSIRAFPAGRLRTGRPISLETIKVGERLTRVVSQFTWNLNWEYCQKIVHDHHEIYREYAHPGWLLSRANLILAANYALPPWIHVTSAVQNYGAHKKECPVETRGLVRERFERKGHHFIVLDLGLFAEDRCLATIRHTAIFRIAPQAA